MQKFILKLSKLISVKKLFIVLGILNSSFQLLNADAFLLGERLDYGVYLNGMRLGSATLQVQIDIADEKNIRCLVFKSTAKSDSFLGNIYPVDDKMISHYDFAKKRVVSAMKKVHEGKKHREYHVDFDYASATASWWQKQRKGSKEEVSGDETFRAKSGITSDIPTNTLDALSALYKFRYDGNELIPGSTIYFPIYDDLQVTLLSMEIVKEETIELDASEYKGDVSSVLVKPRLETSGFFRSDGELNIWFSKDFRRIPLKIASRVKKIGKVEIVLEATSGLANP